MVQNNEQLSFRDLFVGGLVAYGLFKALTGDTVVYYLYRGNRLVYIGVTYKDRLEQRLDEHDRNGVIAYDEYDYSRSMSRSSALAKEMREIKLHRPKYNIHHNYC